MHIHSLKSTTKKLQIERIPDPDIFWMPLQSYQGQMKPVVKSGDFVFKHQLIARSNDNWSISLHAPVSGFISETKEMNNQHYLKLKNDFKNQEDERALFDIEKLSREEILDLIRDFGIVGSGGAGFPTHIKYNTKGNAISHFIMNGVECEPYLSADYALLKENGQQIIQTAAFIQKLIGCKHIVLAIEKQHRELKSIVEHIGKELNIKLQIQLMDNSYPQGSELQLIKAITKKEVPKGSLPAHHGVIVSNVATIHALGKALWEGKPYTERIVTISGEAGGQKGNYCIKIGTPVSHVFNQTNTRWHPDEQYALFGGPMMGKMITNPNESIAKETAGLLLIKKQASRHFNCIQCGYCSDACPQRLMPMEFARSAPRKNKADLLKHNIDLCIECGACAYVCPSEVPLMESIIQGKQLIRN